LRIAVTGADGFIGQSLCTELEHRGHDVRRITRRSTGAGRIPVADLYADGALQDVLENMEAVVHLAGRAHVVRDTALDPAAEFQRANVDGTRRLASRALDAGVRRLVFVSSVHVNGMATWGVPFTEADVPAPTDAYARSKLEAERLLQQIAADRLELVVVRPPMVYGPGVKGNFLRLLSLVDAGAPLPLGSVANKRSLIGVHNLSELLALCVEHPAAAGQLFLAAEPAARATPELLRTLAAAMQRPARVFPFPVPLLRMAATTLGVRAEFEKLCSSLEVCGTKARTLLGWKPGMSYEAGIASTVAWFKDRQHVAR